VACTTGDPETWIIVAEPSSLIDHNLWRITSKVIGSMSAAAVRV
jgi:hypothetical protein